MDEKHVILIIDDNPTNLSMLFEYLEESDFEVSVAQSGERALQQLQHVQPDLILLDVIMPGIDGFETCRQLKGDPLTCDIPVIFMTALTDTVDKLKGFLAGGADYITKPLQHEEVLARITAHLKIRELRRQVESQQARLQEQEVVLAQKDQMLEEFQFHTQTLFSYISSDIYSPLNSLLGFTRVILENIDHYSKEQIKNDVQRLQTAAEKLYAQHENLIIWAKLQRGILEYAPETVSLDELAIYNMILFTPQAKPKQITLHSDIQEHAAAYADYKMVNIILQNLLSNAIKFTHQGGRITLSTQEHDDEMIKVVVADTGIGISQEHIRRLLGQYIPSSDETFKQNKEKIGLGLLLCKKLAEKHGSSIRIESQPGKGTAVFFTLPKHPPAEGKNQTVMSYIK